MKFYRYVQLGPVLELFLSWDGDKRGWACYWQVEDGTLEVWAGGLYLSINRPTNGSNLNGGNGPNTDPHGDGGVP